LDKRVFLDNKSISDATNLIMFGTPNAGAPLASPNDSCSPTANGVSPHSKFTSATYWKTSETLCING